MDEAELAECRAALGVGPEASLEELERVFMRRNFALLKGKAGAADEPKPELEAERQKLRAAYEKLAVQLRAQQAATVRHGAPRGPGPVPPPLERLLTPPVVQPHDPANDEFALFTFDNWKINLFVPPLLFGLTWLVTISPPGVFLKGFHVWMHEFGHATAAWLAGWRATPLPFGWTSVEQVHSNFVYFGLLLMFGLLFAAGLKERKVWPMIAAAGLALLQYYMTWRMSDQRKEFWEVFGGVGGEFYLSTLFMMFFYVQLPEKFRWGGCRYVFFMIGATAFLNIWLRWADIHRGLEEIPFGSMINGEDDQGGDMNRLMDEFGWTKFDIRRNYWLLGNWCLVTLGVTWAIFALRLNKVADRVVAAAE